MSLHKKPVICLFAILCLLGVSIPSFAQQGKSEVSLGYGLYSFYTFHNEKPYNTSSGTGILTYKYYWSKKLTLGMSIGYENLSNKGSYLSFTPEFTYNYFDNPHHRIRVRMYSGASIGLTVFDDFYRYNDIYSQHHDETGPQFTGNVTPFGIRIGRKLAWYMELGFGYKGLISSGISYRFKTERKPHTDN
ncbi:MAG: hypothetical protein EBX41_03270 [Chitinophagia bacterium]|nr:hypothetical protein [Chitinophagia bacterium]